MKSKRNKLVILTLVAFLIPPAVIITINFLNGLSTLEVIAILLTHWSLTAFTLPYYIGGPLIINSLLKKTETLLKEGKVIEAQNQYFVISRIFLILIFTYGLVSIPITMIVPGYSETEILYSVIVAIFYVLTSCSPLLVKFTELLDDFYGNTAIDRKNMYGIRAKLSLNTALSSIGGIGLISSSFYILMWRIVDFPERGIVFNDALLRISIIAAIIILLQILPNLFLGSIIVKNIKKVENFTLTLSAKDLTKSIDLHARDEFGVISNQLIKLNNNLKSIITQVITNSKQVDQSSDDLNQLSQDYASTSSDQAASSEEIAASIEEIAANITLSNERAQECRVINLKSEVLIGEGQSVVEETLGSMENISVQIKLLTEIANQTNLLAINASIEAVNAGEYGKGFLVVAKEVRSLADKSREASNKIVSLVSESLKNSQTSKEKMDDIVPIIKQTTNLSLEIASSSEEQKIGTDQINTAIQNFTQSSQVLAQSSSKLSSSSKILAKKADELLGLVSAFKV